MEEKGIVLPELSCRTAAELPQPDFSAPGGHPPEQVESFGRSSAPGVHHRSGSSALGVQSLSPPCWVHGLQRVKAKVPFP